MKAATKLGVAELAECFKGGDGVLWEAVTEAFDIARKHGWLSDWGKSGATAMRDGRMVELCAQYRDDPLRAIERRKKCEKKERKKKRELARLVARQKKDLPIKSFPLRKAPAIAPLKRGGVYVRQTHGDGAGVQAPR